MSSQISTIDRGRLDLASNNHQHRFPFIFLYGPSGSGKSVIAPRLANFLGLSWLDLDVVIEQRTGCTVNEIFARFGEEGFRKIEAEMLSEVVSGSPVVVALGGGTLLDPQNRQFAEKSGRVVCLSASLDVLLTRIKMEKNSRPLLEVAGDCEAERSERLSSLLDRRRSHYSSFPIQVGTEVGSPTELARKIMADLGYFYLRRSKPSDGAVYPIYVQPGELGRLGKYLRQFARGGPVVVVADSRVAGIYGEQTVGSLDNEGYQTSLVTFSPGEPNKNLVTVASLYRSFLEAGLERHSTVIALGGGITNDLAGFAAATYLRGISWVAIPTTLLAMADAAVGGKTGCNLPEGKNLVGAFHSPELVIADSQTLSTLPRRELLAGLAEVVKAGLIADPQLFEMCSRGEHKVVEHLDEIIRRSIAVKMRFVQEDPFESSTRAALNLGHTLGHALEIASGFDLLHGEAVAIGLVGEAYISEAIGLARPGLASDISACLSRLGLPVSIPEAISEQAIVEAAWVDKKRHNGKLRFTLPKCPGQVQVGVTVDEWAKWFHEWRVSQ